METLIMAAFSELQSLDLLGAEMSALLEYLALLNDMRSIFQDVSTASTYSLARACCRSLKLSKAIVIYLVLEFQGPTGPGNF